MECRKKILLKSGLIVPCGKCPACLANNRQEWIFRLQQEYKDSIFSVFVTFTYSDEFLPSDGVCKEDMQKFHKRLRKHFPSGDLRFFVVSEYGDHTQRAHYHGLYFFKHKYELDYIYDIFLKSWSKGFIKFGEVEEGSIVYCTKYCLKLTLTPDGKNPTFRLISKMDGGLGSSYLEKMSDYHISNNQFIFVADNGKKCRMPRYFRDKIDPFKGARKYNPLHFRIEDDIAKDRGKKLSQDFGQYLSEHKFQSFEEARRGFEDFQRCKYENRDELLIKHVKKQKL